jgi:D-apionolactonase
MFGLSPGEGPVYNGWLPAKASAVPTRYEYWYGRDQPPVKRHRVHAGALTAVLEGGDVRYVQVGGVEILRRLFTAVRDRNWDTVPAVISDFELDVMSESFRLTFSATNTSDEIEFAWNAEVKGSTQGVLSYELEGRAARAFGYCRIGLCVLHPIEAFAGRPYNARTETGQISGSLPRLIGPQEVEDGLELPLFPSFNELEVQLSDGLVVSHHFEGDYFEMEDQRNWTDASFKTYSTPLALGYPHDASAGQRFYQSVVVRPSHPRRQARPPRDEIAVVLGEAPARSMPRIGIGLATEEATPSERQLELLAACGLDHLRVDVDLLGAGWPVALDRGIREAAQIECALELAVFVGDDANSELRGLADALPDELRIARVLVHEAGAAVASPSLLSLARAHLRGHVIAASTNAYFAQLNAFRPSSGEFDGVSYPISPQVHAFDEASLVETLAAQAETVATARSFCGSAAIFVSPITLLPRFNSDAAEPAPPPPAGELPANVDPRQMSLFGAAWTLGSLKYLSESGASAVTYYETIGWRGLIANEPGVGRVHEQFPSEPGLVFPLYHVVADIAGLQGAQVIPCRSSDPLRCDAVVLRPEDREVVMLANFTSDPISVVLDWLHGRVTGVRSLDESTVQHAAADPRSFRDERQGVELARSGLEIAPYGVVRVDAARSSR